MQPKVTGEVTLLFVRGGMSPKSRKPYLMLANGRKELFVNLSPQLQIDENTFTGRESDTPITLQVELTAGSDEILVKDILE